MTIADRIKYLREKQGLSQEALANKIGLKDKSSIAKIEKSGNKITLKHVEKISEALGCSIPYLMGWEEEAHDTVIADYRKKLEEYKKAHFERYAHFIDLVSRLDDKQQKQLEKFLEALSEDE